MGSSSGLYSGVDIADISGIPTGVAQLRRTLTLHCARRLLTPSRTNSSTHLLHFYSSIAKAYWTPSNTGDRNPIPIRYVSRWRASRRPMVRPVLVAHAPNVDAFGEPTALAASAATGCRSDVSLRHPYVGARFRSALTVVFGTPICRTHSRILSLYCDHRLQEQPQRASTPATHQLPKLDRIKGLARTGSLHRSRQNMQFTV